MREYETLKTRLDLEILYIRIYRPDHRNAINSLLIEEFLHALKAFESKFKIVVIEGSDDYFCFGADFESVANSDEDSAVPRQDAGALYDLWLKLANGPFVSVACVKGQANAGGIGFVAACDIVLAQKNSTFSLSELVFDLIPACVLPFLSRRMGVSRANHVAIMTAPMSAENAKEWGLVDVVAEDIDSGLRKVLLRLRRLSGGGIERYKNYAKTFNSDLYAFKEKAVETNHQVFSDGLALSKIKRYVNDGRFPWE